MFHENKNNVLGNSFMKAKTMPLEDDLHEYLAGLENRKTSSPQKKKIIRIDGMSDVSITDSEFKTSSTLKQDKHIEQCASFFKTKHQRKIDSVSTNISKTVKHSKGKSKKIEKENNFNVPKLLSESGRVELNSASSELSKLSLLQCVPKNQRSQHYKSPVSSQTDTLLSSSNVMVVMTKRQSHLNQSSKRTNSRQSCKTLSPSLKCMDSESSIPSHFSISSRHTARRTRSPPKPNGKIESPSFDSSTDTNLPRAILNLEDLENPSPSNNDIDSGESYNEHSEGYSDDFDEDVNSQLEGKYFTNEDNQPTPSLKTVSVSDSLALPYSSSASITQKKLTKKPIRRMNQPKQKNRSCDSKRTYDEKFKNAETWTDAGLVRAVWESHSQPPQPPWHPTMTCCYDQSAFVAAVTSAVNEITSKRNLDLMSIVQPNFLDKTVLNTMTPYNPCVTALDNMLRQQLQLTRDFLSSHAQLHRAFTGAIQKCVAPSPPSTNTLLLMQNLNLRTSN